MSMLSRYLFAAIVATTLSLATLNTAHAQAPAPAPGTSAVATNEEGLSTRWAMAYGLVGLGIVLGLLNVCRPGKRKGDLPKPG
ncbi:MAG TPA: hypothetical protein VL096_01535 [Pirellulaceae bacterium]|nr:hypothetical protein [Pirellulaceae bacterium]